MGVPHDAIFSRKVRIAAKNTIPSPGKSQRLNVPVMNHSPVLVRIASSIATMPVESAMP